MTSPDKLHARDRLIVALDFSSAAAAVPMAERLRGHVGLFKVGSQLFTAEGPLVARHLAAAGDRIFLDLKFHDIPNTVREAARQAAEMGVTMFSVHASGGPRMMEAALEGAHQMGSGRDRPRILAVTVLTSLGRKDLVEIGVTSDPETAVIRLACVAQRAGLDGVVASPHEIGAIRRACGPGLVVVTPGVRPADAATNDQARTATPQAAIRAGADYLVVGRPITGNHHPVAAADAVVAEMEKAASGVSA